ncbi:hypothetical protein [Rhodobium gokarnense]|uniref:Uncharacterized protein n=1 Tax=Rhodobium gokarnense TaxID=364296 RepID=A0ABT3HA76_9HYPH|nr:hypothetical protein [Rhodobium gokarnense]MCW2307307.1 hypothetical protein [Rhodobium gokarnense]
MTRLSKIAVVGIALGIAATTVPASAETFKTDKYTVSIADDAVTGADALYKGMWVGDVTRDGKTETWLQLSDRYGEVVYEAAIHANESHVLPGGYAIVVRSNAPAQMVNAKTYTDRVAPDATQVATTRIIREPKNVEKVSTETKRDIRAAHETAIRGAKVANAEDTIRRMKEAFGTMRIAGL